MGVNTNSIETVQKGSRLKLRLPRFTLRRRKMMWGYFFLLVPLAYLLAVRFIPTLLSLNMSFREWSILSPVKSFVGFDNFIKLAEDARFLKALSNNLIITVIAVPLQILVGLVAALLLRRLPRMQSLYRLIYFIPFMTIMPAVARVWRWAYAPEIGTFNMVLQKLGFDSQPFLQSPDQALYAIILVIIWQSIGFSVVIMLAGLNQIPRVFYEAAEIDGASTWQQLRRITIPLLNPSIVFLLITLTIGALQTFTLVFLLPRAWISQALGSPLDSTHTLVLYIYEMGFQNYKMGYAAAITVVMLLIMMTLTIFQVRLLSRRIEY